MSSRELKMTVAMARAANITLGRDALNHEDMHETIVQLSHAFDATLQTILTEDDIQKVRPVGISIEAHGVILHLIPSEIPDENHSEWPWNNPLEKLADVFMDCGASVISDGRIIQFTVPIDAIKKTLLDPPKLAHDF